jgi:hypothetical protein
MSGDEGDNDYLDRHVADEEANPLGRLQDQRMREALVEAIKNLPEREQYVMSMYYEHDMNLKEIAVVLKVTESRVCQLHSQSIARLRTRLREWEGGGRTETTTASEIPAVLRGRSAAAKPEHVRRPVSSLSRRRGPAGSDEGKQSPRPEMAEMASHPGSRHACHRH